MSKKTVPVVKVQKTTRWLRYVFTAPELLQLGNDLAELNNAMHAVHNEKKRILADFAARIKSKEADISIASNKIATGYEVRSVPVTVRLHDPGPGKKTVVRDDTLETLPVETMSAEEMQEIMLLEEPSDQ